MRPDDLLNALRRLKHLDPDREDQLQGYLRRSLVNLIRDDFRRARRTPPAEPLDENMLAWTPTPLRQTMVLEAMRRYRAALERLTPRGRAAIVGRFEKGLSYEQLAGQLNRPTPAVARLAVVRATQALHREMGAPRRRPSTA